MNDLPTERKFTPTDCRQNSCEIIKRDISGRIQPKKPEEAGIFQFCFSDNNQGLNFMEGAN